LIWPSVNASICNARFAGTARSPEHHWLTVGAVTRRRRAISAWLPSKRDASLAASADFMISLLEIGREYKALPYQQQAIA
jgi:hypothetical protein